MSDRAISIIMLCLLVPVALSFSAVMLSDAFDWGAAGGTVSVRTSAAAPDPADAIRAEADKERQEAMLQQVLTELNEYRAKAEDRIGFPVGTIVWAMVAMVGILTAAALGYALIRRRHPAPTPVGMGYPPQYPQLPPAPPYYYGYPGAYTDAQYQIESDGRPIGRINYQPDGQYPVMGRGQR